MRLIFNSLSLKGLNNIDSVVISIDNLFKIKSRLKNDISIELLFHSNITLTNLDNGSNFINFLETNETGENSEYINFLRNKIFNVPYIDEIEENFSYEISFNNSIVPEFRLPYAFEDCYLKSFFSHTKWEEFDLDCKRTFLDEISAEIISVDTRIKNIGNIAAVQENSWIKELLSDDQEIDLASFLESMDKYKFLLFSNDLKQSINSYGEDKTLIKALDKNFKIMENYCQNHWKFGKLRIIALKELGLNSIKPESEPTLLKYGNQRLFNDHNGIRQTEPFSIHFNLPDFRRCYIKEINENNEKKILVGYVGEHLSTVENP